MFTKFYLWMVPYPNRTPRPVGRTLFGILINDIFPIGVTNLFGALCGTTYACVYLHNCCYDKREGVNRQAWLTFTGALLVIG